MCMYYFSYDSDSILLRRWAVPQSPVICISNRLGRSDILLMCLFVPFLIQPRALTITGTVEVLRYHIFQFLFSDICNHLFYWERCESNNSPSIYG